MSRSYRKPYSAITGVRSAADDKKVARRAHRQMQNQKLQRFLVNNLDWDEFINPNRLESSYNDVWGWGRDGKQTLQFPPTLGPHFGWWRTAEEEQDLYERQLKWYQKLHRK
jgi:hypothetical protein